MGRKIPGRKHHGIRDPEKQRLERFKRIKDKINAPPANPDDQQIPKSLQRLSELRDKAKMAISKRKKAKKTIHSGGFVQGPHETDRQFLFRVQKACDVVKREADFEAKFGVQIKKNQDGTVENVVKAQDPIKNMLKEVRREKREKKMKKKSGGGNEETRLNKSQKRRLKLMQKKKKKQDGKIDEFKKFQDNVKFGEQAHAPPTLTVPKKIQSQIGAPRPGKKELLLKSILQPLDKSRNKVIDKTGKRKDLPNALRRQLDKQQQEVVQAYRLLKGKKQSL